MSRGDEVMISNQYFKILFPLLFTASLNVHAATASFSILSTNFYGNSYFVPQSAGYVFEPLDNVVVSSLGFFDYLEDGLGESHTIGIFNSTGNLLTSAVVSSGMEKPLEDGFRYTDIAPLTLNTGQSYTVAALFLTNADFIGYSDVEDTIVNSSISLGAVPARYILQTGTDIQFPTDTDMLVTEMFYGPNFKLTVVPLPGAVIFLALELPD
jgi:hypothetical protein